MAKNRKWFVCGFLSLLLIFFVSVYCLYFQSTKVYLLDTQKNSQETIDMIRQFMYEEDIDVYYGIRSFSPPHKIYIDKSDQSKIEQYLDKEHLNLQ